MNHVLAEFNVSGLLKIYSNKASIGLRVRHTLLQSQFKTPACVLAALICKSHHLIFEFLIVFILGFAGFLKVETIGDAYMVVGGVPVPTQSHAHRVANFALGMRLAAKEVPNPVTGQAIQVRLFSCGSTKNGRTYIFDKSAKAACCFGQGPAGGLWS